MVATRADIDSDMTLEIDGRTVTPDLFLRGVRAFFGIVREVTRDVCGERPVDIWRVQVKDGSNLIGIDRVPGFTDAATIAAISERVRTGLETLEERAEEPSWFPRPAIKHLRDLGAIVGTDEGNDTRVRVWIKQDALGVTQRTVANAAELLREAYEDHGSVEGRLQVASERGALHVVLYEPVWDKPIRCYMDEDQMEEALSHFGKRVEIFGMVKYRKDGSASSIRAEQISPFPLAADLPQVDTMVGILRDYD